MKSKTYIVDGMNGHIASLIVHIEIFDLKQHILLLFRGSGMRFCNKGCHLEVTALLFLEIKCLRGGRSTRKRGFDSSSIPKLINVKPAHSKAMHIPAGTNCHHFPTISAALFSAQYNITPQLGREVSPRPRNSRATSAPTAYTNVPTNVEAM